MYVCIYMWNGGSESADNLPWQQVKVNSGKEEETCRSFAPAAYVAAKGNGYNAEKEVKSDNSCENLSARAKVVRASDKSKIHTERKSVELRVNRHAKLIIICTPYLLYKCVFNQAIVILISLITEMYPKDTLPKFFLRADRQQLSSLAETLGIEHAKYGFTEVSRQRRHKLVQPGNSYKRRSKARRTAMQCSLQTSLSWEKIKYSVRSTRVLIKSRLFIFKQLSWCTDQIKTNR